MIEIVCFTGQSGLTDYAVSLARSLQGRAALVTAESLPAAYRQLGFAVHTPFRRSRHLGADYLRFARGLLQRRPAWALWQGPIKWPLIDALLARCLRALGQRCALTVHDVTPHQLRPWSRAFSALYHRSFDRLIAHSHAAEGLLRAQGVRAPILVVPHGVYDLFRLRNVSRAQARAELGLADAEPVALFFGHLEARKGLAELLAVAAALPATRFIVAGEPGAGCTPALLALCATLPNVRLLAQRIPHAEVEPLFAAADAVLLPYQEGSTSGVLKLALAFGVPVLASDVGDLPEQVPPAGGPCVPLGDGFVPRYTAALQALLANPGAWRASAPPEAQWPAIAARIEAFLD